MSTCAATKMAAAALEPAIFSDCALKGPLERARGSVGRGARKRRRTDLNTPGWGGGFCIPRLSSAPDSHKRWPNGATSPPRPNNGPRRGDGAALPTICGGCPVADGPIARGNLRLCVSPSPVQPRNAIEGSTAKQAGRSAKRRIPDTAQAATSTAGRQPQANISCSPVCLQVRRCQSSQLSEFWAEPIAQRTDLVVPEVGPPLVAGSSQHVVHSPDFLGALSNEDDVVGGGKVGDPSCPVRPSLRHPVAAVSGQRRGLHPKAFLLPLPYNRYQGFAQKYVPPFRIGTCARVTPIRLGLLVVSE